MVFFGPVRALPVGVGLTDQVPDQISFSAHPHTSGDLAGAIKLIGDAACGDDTAEAARRQILEFVARYPDALHRSCLAGHLTGSALVVDADHERVLLMLHAKLNMWLQPGGHCDGDGDLAAVALREATEETGIAGLRVAYPAVDCDVHKIPARPGEPEHLHHDVRFVVVAPPGAIAEGNHESHKLAWVTPEEASQLATDASLLRLIASGLKLAQTL